MLPCCMPVHMGLRVLVPCSRTLALVHLSNLNIKYYPQAENRLIFSFDTLALTLISLDSLTFCLGATVQHLACWCLRLDPGRPAPASQLVLDRQ